MYLRSIKEEGVKDDNLVSHEPYFKPSPAPLLLMVYKDEPGQPQLCHAVGWKNHIYSPGLSKFLSTVAFVAPTVAPPVR
jgi:hypothetical protein